MRDDGLVARMRKRYRSTTMSDHDQPIAANVLDRPFAAERPNQRWVGDTTEFVIERSPKVYARTNAQYLCNLQTVRCLLKCVAA
jgi:transposase InsO family protein